MYQEAGIWTLRVAEDESDGGEDSLGDIAVLEEEEEGKRMGTRKRKEIEKRSKMGEERNKRKGLRETKKDKNVGSTSAEEVQAIAP